MGYMYRESATLRVWAGLVSVKKQEQHSIHMFRNGLSHARRARAGRRAMENAADELIAQLREVRARARLQYRHPHTMPGAN